jgi:hypothetical protein
MECWYAVQLVLKGWDVLYLCKPRKSLGKEKMTDTLIVPTTTVESNINQVRTYVTYEYTKKTAFYGMVVCATYSESHWGKRK